MDKVFKALADATRRSLMDALFEKDGQTLGELERRVDMTRFGVMKHLRILEDAGIVKTLRRGREKLHFLNPVPIRLIHDRWVSKFAEPWVAILSDLKHELEKKMEKVFEIYIKATPERVWEAITDPRQRAIYNFGMAIESDWKSGSKYTMGSQDGSVILGEGEMLEVEPPVRLVQTMVAFFSDEAKAEGTSRITWQIEPVGEDSCRVTIVHDQLREGANSQIYGGWPMILSGLKTWIETGEMLTTPGSLRYVGS